MKYLYPLILERKNLGKLYHILDYEKFLFVVKTNTIQSYKAGGGNISLTRNKMLNGYVGDNPTSFIKFEIDGDKLSDKYKIVPFRYRSGTGIWFNEYEEQVRTKIIPDVFSYIDKVIIMKNRINYLLRSANIEDFPSDYATTVGTVNGNIRDIITTIIEGTKKYGKELYVQEGSVIKKDDVYINSLENYHIEQVERKFFICYRGGIPLDYSKYGKKDVLLDFDGRIIQNPCVVGHELNIKDIYEYNLIEIHHLDDAKRYIDILPNKEFSEYGDKKFEPYFIALRLLKDGKWKLDSLTPLYWIQNYSSHFKLREISF